MHALQTSSLIGHTSGMKTAVSIPDEIFAGGEALAHHLGISRSRLYARAVAEYVSRHAPDAVTAALDLVCGELGVGTDPFVAVAGRRILEETEW